MENEKGYVSAVIKNPGRKKEIDPKNNKRNSIAEGAFSAASASMSESYIVPFMVHLNATNLQIGLLSSFQNLAAMIAQIPGSKLPGIYPRKFVCVLSKIFKTGMWAAVLIAFIAMPSNVVAFMALFTLVSLFKSLKRPSWTGIMGDIVPHQDRVEYFARRTFIVELGGFLSMAASGFILALTGFSTLFLISIVLESASIMFFLKIADRGFRKKYSHDHDVSFDVFSVFRNIRVQRNLAAFTTAMIALQVAVAIVVPFIPVYILRDIGMSYELYSISLALGILARILSYRYWGKLNKMYGNKPILLVSGVLIALVPFIYLFSSDPLHIMLIKIFDGFAWSGFDIVVFNSLLMLTNPQKRTELIATYTFLITGGTVIGAYLGGVVSVSVPALLGFEGFHVLFLLSFIGRSIAMGVISLIKEEYPKPVKDIMWEMFILKPGKRIRVF